MKHPGGPNVVLVSNELDAEGAGKLAETLRTAVAKLRAKLADEKETIRRG